MMIFLSVHQVIVQLPQPYDPARMWNSDPARRSTRIGAASCLGYGQDFSHSPSILLKFCLGVFSVRLF